MKVTLVDSPFANVASIERALRHEGGEVAKTADPLAIERSERVVLPGVGTFLAAAQWLESSKVGEALHAAVARGAALLGICVGHQLLFDDSDEVAPARGLALCRGSVRRFDGAVAVPQIGWNRLSLGCDPLFDGIDDGTPFYFVNSYRATGVPAGDEIATAVYGAPFTAAVARDRVRGVQFHPEKSSRAGLRVLRNFLEKV